MKPKKYSKRPIYLREYIVKGEYEITVTATNKRDAETYASQLITLNRKHYGIKTLNPTLTTRRKSTKLGKIKKFKTMYWGDNLVAWIYLWKSIWRYSKTKEEVSKARQEVSKQRQQIQEFSQQKPWIVIETAKELTKPEYCVDVLKAEFPLNLEFAEELRQDPTEICQQLDEASQIPWVILSAGVDYEEFTENLQYAVNAGASGFLCGRAIWKEAIGGKNRDIFLHKTSVGRLNRLVEIVEQHARPWHTKYVDSLQDINVLRGE